MNYGVVKLLSGPGKKRHASKLRTQAYVRELCSSHGRQRTSGGGSSTDWRRVSLQHLQQCDLGMLMLSGILFEPCSQTKKKFLFSSLRVAACLIGLLVPHALLCESGWCRGRSRWLLQRSRTAIDLLRRLIALTGFSVSANYEHYAVTRIVDSTSRGGLTTEGPALSANFGVSCPTVT